MNITIEIPGLDALAAAINNLASAYGGAPAATDAKPTRATTAKTKVVEKDPEPEVDTATDDKPVSLTAEDVKKMAAKLTMTEGGNDKLRGLFEQFGAKRFSEVPAEKLGEFAQALVKADSKVKEYFEELTGTASAA